MTQKFLIAFALIILHSCKTKTDSTAHSAGAANSGKSKQARIARRSFSVDTIFQDNNVIVLGDTSFHTANAIQNISIRFKPYIRFSDFRVDTINANKKAAIQFSSNPTARQFKTVIKATYESEGLNFAGHYCFVQWGCGSPCQSSALVDLKTGIVYDGVNASLGYKYEKESRMLIVNPPDSTGFYPNCAYCEPLIYIWNDKSKVFDQRL